MSDCGQCGSPIPVDSVSNYFCSERHQLDWYKTNGPYAPEPAAPQVKVTHTGDAVVLAVDPAGEGAVVVAAVPASGENPWLMQVWGVC